VRVTVDDGSGNLSNLPIANVDLSGVTRQPTVNTITNQSITRGATLTQTGSFVDPYGTSWTATVDYGDGTGPQPLALNPDHTFTLSHSYAAATGAYHPLVSVTNNLGGVGTYGGATFTVVAPIQVSGVQVNDGNAQRSMVKTLVVTFNRAVAVDDAGAFTVVADGSGAVAPDVSVSFNADRTQATLSFSGASVIGGSVADGRYQLALDTTKLHDDSGGLLDGDNDGQSGGAYAGYAFFRYFGDVSGEGTVNGLDYGAFRAAFGSSAGDAAYRDYFDYNADTAVNGFDYSQFRARFGTTLP
jgi:hypothetical protein